MLQSFNFSQNPAQKFLKPIQNYLQNKKEFYQKRLDINFKASKLPQQLTQRFSKNLRILKTNQKCHPNTLKKHNLNPKTAKLLKIAFKVHLKLQNHLK